MNSIRTSVLELQDPVGPTPPASLGRLGLEAPFEAGPADSGDDAREVGERRILVVDDEPGVARCIQRLLGQLGYEAHTATNVVEALEHLTRSRYDLVITDLRMPESTGLDLLLEVRSRYPETRVILISGAAEVEDLAIALDRGVDALITKPFGIEEVRIRVADSLRRGERAKRREIERRRLLATVKERKLESGMLVLRAARSLAAAVEVRDAYTAGHSIRVATYGVTIARALGAIDLDLFQLAADLHDVGKIGVPDQVLNKTTALTPGEAALVRRHPVEGERILKPLIDDDLVLGVVRSHHERWDGAGYPDGLMGTQIPLAARVLAVADTLDAMTSCRAYRDGLPWDDAVAEIRACSGTQFDPDVVWAFEAVLATLEDQYLAHLLIEEANRTA